MKKNIKEFKKKRDLKKFRRKLFSKFKRKIKHQGLLNLNKVQKKLYLLNERATRNFHITIVCPKNFSLLNNKEEFIKFINKVEKAGANHRSIYFNMVSIENIDFSGITCLTSILLMLKKNHVNFDGSLPVEPNCRKFLLNSDFLKILSNTIFNADEDVNIKFARKEKSFITKGRKFVSPDIAGDANIMVSQHLFKKNDFVNDGLQTILLELMANTNNHASNIQGKEHWFLSVQLDDKDTVKFNFVDYGIGIFKSLETTNFISKLRHFFTTNHECLKQMLKGEYHIKSSTGLTFRGKGIPSLYTAIERDHVKKLIIITNDAYGDIENDIFVKNNNYFNGTFISWEVSINNSFINIKYDANCES